jgi:hypothetical protein
VGLVLHNQEDEIKMKGTLTLTVNVNDKVRVHLTEKGKEIYQAYYPNEKIEDAIETQLWTLMQIFGSRLSIGGDILFVNNEISFEEKIG